MKELENIKDMKDLMSFIQAHGIPTDTDSIIKMQDIVGNTNIEILVDYANDNNTKGKFYTMLFDIWNWEDAIRFYNQHSNHQYQDLEMYQEQSKVIIQNLKNDVDMLEKNIERQHNEIVELRAQVQDAKDENLSEDELKTVISIFEVLNSMPYEYINQYIGSQVIEKMYKVRDKLKERYYGIKYYKKDNKKSDIK